jgi:hypothetical protein
MGKVLTFEKPKELRTSRDATEYSFPFRMVDSNFVGAPEEMTRSTQHTLIVSVSGTLESCWQLSTQLLIRILFEYGQRHVKQKILDGALSQFEELFLHTGNTETSCPFDPNRIEDPSGATLEIENTGKPLMEDPTFLQLASRIIDARDNINALFHNKHGEKLIVVREERDLLQLFRNAISSEELSYRVCALANIATGLNFPKLQALTRITDKEVKSIKLLETYLLQHSMEERKVIETLQKINNLRQGYPVHSDRSRGVLAAHKYFGLTYPVLDHSHAWRSILRSYLDSLERLLDKLKG